MKKVILGLFLILAVASYSVPNFVDKKRVEGKGYSFTQDVENFTVTFQKADKEGATTITYWYGSSDPSPAELNKSLKSEASQALAPKQSLKMGRALVEKYSGKEGFLYTIVFKNSKPADVLTSVAYFTPNEYPSNQLNKLVDKLLAESESFVK
ncbi:hypothetical protein [Fusobacterium massiliense]|uniref:hypothetical protein n=1 Tax=Fusobacterium massiliense TaxID=1852365 RepID=UPI0028EA0DA8|nr:hypothetical protein [Fusobacterium massiliense]